MTARVFLPIAGAACLIAAVVVQPMHAETAPAAPASAAAPLDVEACKACHGPQGVSVNPSFPNLAGQKQPYLETQLKAFRVKDRKNPLMNAIAGQLSDDEIKALAQYWSSLPATPAADAHGGAGSGPAIASRMEFPKGFPNGFTVYQTESENGVITKRYANAVAWKAAKAGQHKFPDGAIIVQASYKAEKDAAGHEIAGALTNVAAMELRAGWGAAVPALLRNGDWDYAVFSPEGVRRDALNEAPCMACHKPQEADDYMFTGDKLRAAAQAGG